MMSVPSSRVYTLRPQCGGAGASVRMQPLSNYQQPQHVRGYLPRRLCMSKAPRASWIPYTRQNQEYRDLLAKRAAAYERRITEDKFPPMPQEVEQLTNTQPQSDPVAPSTSSPPNNDPSSGSSGNKRLSAVEQMKILREAQAKSQLELAKASVNDTIGLDPDTPREFRGHRTVDVRMYDQLSASRNRMSQNLSRANKYINILESDIEERDAHIAEMKRVMDGFKSEMATLMRLTERAKAAAQFSVDKQSAVDEMDKIMERVQMLDQVAMDDVAAMDKFVVRQVPVSYSGTGAEVRIMGDFDGWTMGKQLSAAGMGDSVFQTFTTNLYLLPGRYRVKFLVDAEWRTAGDWETITDSKGNLENELIVQ